MLITTDVTKAVKAIASGHLCAIPTETVYGLGADATNPNAISRVFVAKGRPTDHPLIVHVANVTAAYEWVSELPEWATVLTHAVWPGPLTIVAKRTALATDQITGGQETVAVRVPKHPLTLNLLNQLNVLGIIGLVAPSANTFGHVSPTNANHVEHDLGEYLSAHEDLILDGGQCAVGLESTIVLATGDQPIILRPGSLTASGIEEITGVKVITNNNESPRVSGSLASHYAPNAKVIIVDEAELANLEVIKNAGLIALAAIPTLRYTYRIGSPRTSVEFARELYSTLRNADDLDLKVVYVVPPPGSGLAQAILDRINRAAN